MEPVEKLTAINKLTQQELTMEYIERGAVEYGISVDEMLDMMLESIEENF
jgi:hypothetical protein